MTLGEKIRKYRILKGWTQKDLGLAVGFSASTADSRIRKYEKDLMAPKGEIRTKLADVLDVDLAALSDIDIRTDEDVMQALFLFEDLFGMDIEKKDGKTTLVFDDNNRRIRTLITYMNLWRNQKAAILSSPGEASSEQLKAYESWKGKFGTNAREYFSAKEHSLHTHYDPLVEKAGKLHSHFKNTSELALLLKSIVESGFTIATSFEDAPNSLKGPGFTFVVNELLTPPSDQAEELFAQFLSELDYYSSLGADIYTDFQLTDRQLTITYCIPVPSFSVVKSQIDDFLEYMRNSGEENDFLRDNFEIMFRDSLQENSNDIAEEIRLYCSK